MKTTMRTNNTSIIGVMLISDLRAPPPPCVENAMNIPLKHARVLGIGHPERNISSSGCSGLVRVADCDQISPYQSSRLRGTVHRPSIFLLSKDWYNPSLPD